MFQQIKLNYEFSALEPHIDTATMEAHYTLHHAAFTKALNNLVEQIPEIQGKTSEEILKHLDLVPDEYLVTVRNTCGGFLNHNLYFESLSPHGPREPRGFLKEHVEQDFGSFENLKAELKKAALGQFGSGYAWLAYCDKEFKLLIKQTDNQRNPISDGETAVLLPIDVWEHAYYLKHRSNRAAYVDALWNVIDWEVVDRRFEAARKWDVLTK